MFCCLLNPSHTLLSPATKKAIEQTLTNRTPMLSDLYRCSTGIVHVDAVGPILDAGGRPLAVLVSEKQCGIPPVPFDPVLANAE